MEALLFLTIFIAIFALLKKWLFKKVGFEITANEKNSFLFLITWISLGFLTRLDYTDRWGCLFFYEPILNTKNIIFSTISLALITLAFKAKNRNFKKVLCLTELIYWTAKLIVFKGGYAIGHGGTVDISILFYDLTAAYARIFTLSHLFDIVRYKILKSAFLSIIILTIKVGLFSTQLSFIYNIYQSNIRAKEIRKEVIGKWKGEFQKANSKEDTIYGTTVVKIDSQKIFFESVDSLEEEYELTIDSRNSGQLIKKIEQQDLDFWLDKSNEDSLVFRLSQYIYSDSLGAESTKYLFRLKKEKK